MIDLGQGGRESVSSGHARCYHAAAPLLFGSSAAASSASAIIAVMGAIRTQVVFDAADPHRLAAFWADALHYEHEEIDAFVRGLVKAGHVPAEYTIEIAGKLRWRSLASLRHPDDPVDERGAGAGRRILFQAVPETKAVKNRLHLDLLVGPDAHDAEVERLVGLGATVKGVHEGDEGRWTLMTDPEGNEFDVS